MTRTARQTIPFPAAAKFPETATGKNCEVLNWTATLPIICLVADDTKIAIGFPLFEAVAPKSRGTLQLPRRSRTPIS